jgi:peptidoglycan hydrolase CwlO-like protein
MRRTILALAVLLAVAAAPVSVVAQDHVLDSARIEQIIDNQHAQLKRLVYLESEYKVFSNELTNLSNSSDEMSGVVSETLERLAQSERAINATLETFQQKFEEQNQTIADVQQVLESKMQQMLTYIGLGIVAALVVMFVVARSSAAGAVKKHQANWNSFQEHLLKTK